MFSLCSLTHRPQVAEPGSVLFNFQRCGMIVVDGTTEDAVFEAAMEAGAEDVEPVPPEEDGAPSTSYKVCVCVCVCACVCVCGGWG